MKIGEHIPDFSLPNQDGQKIHSQSFIGAPFVIYFYPKDETAGCTAEACSFRDNFEDFKTAGAKVIGISSDTVESHKKFAENHRLPFILLSDVGAKVRKQFDVPRSFLGLIAGRVTYIFDKNGVLVYLFNSQIKATQHIQEALNTIKKLNEEDKSKIKTP